jgi:hypothetical protein
MNILKLVQDILNLHCNSILNWKKEIINSSSTGVLKLVEENHAFNYQLWHAEDRARREDMGHEFVYTAKREIDDCNQKRNNKMEDIDEWMFKQLISEKNIECQIHSETPGMMIDRMSILALKLFHMREQANREDVDDEHRHKCLKKARLIATQQDQLAKCLLELLQEVQNKTRTFKVYHQFKMYNDPALNPELY